MGRKRGHGRRGKRGGGTLSSLRGGFRATVQGATGTGEARPSSPAKRLLGNALTVILLAAAVVVLLRRFGVLRF
jgi:hypothetical protein